MFGKSAKFKLRPACFTIQSDASADRLDHQTELSRKGSRNLQVVVFFGCVVSATSAYKYCNVAPRSNIALLSGAMLAKIKHYFLVMFLQIGLFCCIH